ncbi:ubiquitin carboxyl-hydrolase [Streptococcus sinensis]|uniref:ubiquitin carboxyl-hydrolase n=1 Tax=Streptococcus sinensis TaxID=176090 RepID=UPI00272B5993|nr:ubiquitin carboxyl-hydrolase [Streptococcus sinensis]
MKVYKSLLIFLIGFICLGSITACSQSKTVEEKRKLRKEEEQIALYLVNHYEDVKKIKFDKFHRGGFGIADSISVIVNDDSYIKPIIFNDDSERYSVDYDPSDFHLIKKENSTELTSLDGIEVIYYEEK